MSYFLITWVFIISTFLLNIGKPEKPYHSNEGDTNFKVIEWEGLASYYHNSLHGLRTASGELYNKNKFMAAHKTLAFGSWVWVKDHNSPSTVVVKINDRLPANSTRLIDLSYRAAEEFKLLKMGLKKVTIKVIPPSEAKRWFLERQLQLPDELKN